CRAGTVVAPLTMMPRMTRIRLQVRSKSGMAIAPLAFWSGGPGKVVLARARVEFLNLLNLVRHLTAQRFLLRFSHSPCGFQLDQGFVDGAQRNVDHTRGLAHR